MAQRKFFEVQGHQPWKRLTDRTDKWKTVFSLLDGQFISYYDFALAERLLRPDESFSEEAALAVCYLSAASRSGHLCVGGCDSTLFPQPVEVFQEIAQGSLLSDETLSRRIHSGIQEISSSPLFENLLIRWEGYLYFQKYWYYETLFLEHFERLNSAELNTVFNLEKCPQLLPEQMEAVQISLSQPISIISGGPGTGKTYTAGVLLQLLWDSLSEEQKERFEIVLTAPTGKAAANLQGALSETFPWKAKTLHALLKVNSRRHTSQKLKADVILVDECSMVDIRLMSLLLSSIKKGARLILLGDPFQLPSVENGAVFANMLSMLDKVGRLSRCMRAELQGIVQLAAKVNSGSFEGTGFEGVTFVESLKVGDLVSSYVSAYRKKPEDILKQLTILTPFRQGEWGVGQLNQRILKEVMSLHLKKLYIPVMITKNDVKQDLYNGDVGILVCEAFDPDKGYREEDMVYFGDREFPALLLPKHELAFAISVHKSQGSEYQKVVLVMPEGAELFGREMLYTGATRAKRELEIWGALETVEKTVKKQVKRVSGILDRYKPLQKTTIHSTIGT